MTVRRSRSAAGRCLCAILALACAGLASPVAAAAQEDDPLRRWQYLRERLGPLGNAARLQAARERVLAMPALGAPAGGSAARSGVWEPLGPQVIPVFAGSTGRVSAVTLHPENLNVIFAGGAQGGVWRTDDGGASWRPLTDQECSLAMGAVAVDPVDPSIVYAGTGEAHFSGDSYYGCGVLRSADGGDTWTRLGESVFMSASGYGTSVSRMAVDPATAGSTNATTVLAATTWGLFRSTDSGGSWTEVLEGIVTDLVVDASDPRVVFAAVRGEWSAEGSLPGTLHRSRDGGGTWERLRTERELGNRPQLAQSLSNPAVLYVSSNAGDTLVMARSPDGGDTWPVVAAAGATCFQCWYDQALAVHPTNPDVVYFGGVALFRSDNGGASFGQIMGFPDGIHVDQHILTTDARQPDLLLVGNDGGVYRSVNRGDTWQSLNTNLALTQFYGVSVHPRFERGVGVLGGTQDNGTVEAGAASGAGRPWNFVLGGDGGFTAIHPVANQRWAETQWISESGYSGPRRSDNRGPFELRVSGIDTSENGAFIPPLAMDPFDPSVLYFGAERVYRTTSGGDFWEPILDPGDAVAFATAVAPARSDGRVVYAGYLGGLWVTRNGGDAWEVSLHGHYVTDIAVHPFDAGTAYATIGWFGNPHVFATRDHGRSWTDVTGNLPDHPVNAVLLDPADPDIVYIGTDLGVFASRGGNTWERFGTGLPMSAVFDLAAEPNAGIMVAATHGRGVFALPVEAPLTIGLRRGDARDVAAPWASGPLPGSALARIYGTGWPTARWEARADESWLDVTASSGSWLDSVAWSIDPSALDVGTHVGAIRVEVTGTGADRGSAEIPVRVEILPTETLALGAAGRRTALPQDTIAVADSISVTVEGPRAADAPWTASHGAGSWLALATTTGGGPGVIRWTRDVAGLDPGVHVDTIRVAGPGMLPVAFVDSLEVVRPTTVFVSGELPGPVLSVAGLAEVIADSVIVRIEGWRSRTATWRATSGGSAWLALERASGASGDRLVLRRAVDGLGPGTYADTVRIAVDGAPLAFALLADTLVVGGHVTPERAAAPLLGGAPLGEVESAVLDRLGNANGSYDLGDAVSWIARCRRGEADCGAPGAPPSRPDGPPGDSPALPGGGTSGRGGQRRDARPRVRRRARSRARRRPGGPPRSPGATPRRLPRRARGRVGAIRPLLARGRWRPLWLALSAALLASCSGDDETPISPPSPVPTTLAVSPSGAALESLGQTVRLTAEVRDQNGAVMTGATVAWSSSAAGVAAVDASGLVAAVSNGVATITATSGSASGSAAITVAQKVTSLAVSPAADTLTALGDTLRLRTEATDANGHAVEEADFEWTSGDASVATVDGTGLATATGNGATLVTATSGGASGTAMLAVAQKTAELRVEWGDARIFLGDSLLVAIPVANDSNGHRIASSLVQWRSSDSSVAAVDEEGWVRALAQGDARVTVDVAGAMSHQDYSVELDGGFLFLRLDSPSPSPDAGILLEVEGPGIDSLRVADDYELFESGSPGKRRIIVAGRVSSGPLLALWVPHRGHHAQYLARVLQVADGDYALVEDTAAHALSISK